jgi:hypothetical protein
MSGAFKVNSEIKTTTCYMCACRCGFRVHLRDGAVRYIEGNPAHRADRACCSSFGREPHQLIRIQCTRKRESAILAAEEAVRKSHRIFRSAYPIVWRRTI